MPLITNSYRRDDSLDITGRISDRLAGHFGREAVFRDIDSIPLGADFRLHIDRVLDESDIILAIVEPRWIGPDNEQLRLASPAGPVRLARGRLIVRLPESRLKKVAPPSWEQVSSTERVERRLAEAGIFARPESLAGTHDPKIAKYKVRIEPTYARF